MSSYIFTKHSLERLKQRSISQDTAESVLQHPDHTVPGKKPGTIKFVRIMNGRNIQLIATYLEDQKKWLVVSAWVRGEDDKVPFMWLLITLPFKLLWRCVKWLVRTLTNKLR
ncbi:hypothetical protein BH10PAT2_BH10PAT2_3550 [soil metagenome]